ncbi:MAG: sulfotransferase [Planctomycetota bacterium]|nr:MAG: sulfotransferase [Planctomycetota bacterium]
MSQSDVTKSAPVGGYVDKPWIPRFWEGMTFTAWLRILAAHRFRVAPSRWAMATILLLVGIFNSVLAVIQKLIYGRAIARVRLADDPIFIVGHWRSGTTLLHELMILDPEHAFPDTYACFAPNHFLISRRFLVPFLSLLMPKTRPMDNMEFGWDKPQEDEFALCNQGIPSPYLSMIFPNEKRRYDAFLTLDDVSTTEKARWKGALLWFLQAVSLRNPKRMVLKSPPHTARIRTLLEIFPRARFVHIYRHPYSVFPSTINLWKRLWRDQGLQVPHFENLEEYVFETFLTMYEAFERDRELIPADRLTEVRFEDLTADPVKEMERIYRELDLGDFERVRPAIQEYADSHKNYKKNRYTLPDELRREIDTRWAAFMERYGYRKISAAEEDSPPDCQVNTAEKTEA